MCWRWMRIVGSGIPIHCMEMIMSPPINSQRRGDLDIILGQKASAFLYLFIWCFSGLSNVYMFHVALPSIELTNHTQTTLDSWSSPRTMILEAEGKFIRSLWGNLINNRFQSCGPNLGSRVWTAEINCSNLIAPNSEWNVMILLVGIINRVWKWDFAWEGCNRISGVYFSWYIYNCFLFFLIFFAINSIRISIPWWLEMRNSASQMTVI